MMLQDKNSTSLVQAGGEKYFLAAVSAVQKTLLSGDKVNQYEVSMQETEPLLVCRRANG